MDDITVFTLEALLISQHHGATLAGEGPAPQGGCAFLSPAGDCRIYEHRPYVCRTQGLPLRWLEDPSLAGSPEYRDVCPLSEPPAPLEELSPEGFFTLGDFEGRLATLQLMYDPQMTRVSLRDLFGKLSSTHEPLGGE
ncbi:YkgJ family cysteine cluster protein [Myxococcota bacterium]|nr:YkgJ family cysteine cluster protein [Myxococcota bacterium]